MLISIVTPSFQQAEYIEDALSSVRGQTVCADIEHIVVDGGSSDGTIEILERAVDLRWSSAPDRGQSHALNMGFERSKGEIVGWLNADDFYLPGALESVLRLFELNPDVDCIYGDCCFVDGQGRLLRLKAEHVFSPFVLTYFGCYIPTTAMFFRRELIDSGVVRLLEECHYVMDYELLLRMQTLETHVLWAPKVLAAFRWQGNNKSLDVPRRTGERRRVQDAYDVRPRSRSGRKIAYVAARTVHLALKAANGSMCRQMKWRSRREESMKWWDSEG